MAGVSRPRDAAVRYAQTLLREGRVTVLQSECDDMLRVRRASVRVHGHRLDYYVVDLNNPDPGFTCTCSMVFGTRPGPCGHVCAAALVLGYRDPGGVPRPDLALPEEARP